MRYRLLTILGTVTAAALAYLWPLETMVGMIALAACAFVLMVTAGVCFGLGQKAEQEAHRQRLARAWSDKDPTSEPEALAACISALNSIPEREQMRVAIVLHDRYYAETLEKRTERARVLVATSRAQVQ